MTEIKMSNMNSEKEKAWNIFKGNLGHARPDARKTFRDGFDAGEKAERAWWIKTIRDSINKPISLDDIVAQAGEGE